MFRFQSAPQSDSAETPRHAWSKSPHFSAAARLTVWVLALASLSQWVSPARAAPPSKAKALVCWSQNPLNDDGVVMLGVWEKDADDLWFVNTSPEAACSEATDRSFNGLSAALALPMLEGWSDEDGDIWVNADRLPGTLDGIPRTFASTIFTIQPPSKNGTLGYAIIFFIARNKKGEFQWHRLDAIAEWDGGADDPFGRNFPFGSSQYEVVLSQWIMSHDKKSAKDAYTGPVVDSDGNWIGQTTFYLTVFQP